MVWSFFFVYFAAVLVFDIMLGVDVVTAVRQSVLDSPLVFLAFVMLTEPLTAPPTRPLQMAYGGLVAFLIVPQVHVGSLYFAPELALVIANVFAWLVSAKTNQMVRLIERHPISRDGEEFVFRQERSLRFRPGQYLEWTLPHDHPDDRGDRRFFTITSPPGVDTIAIAVEFSPRPSTFKNRLRTLEPGDTVFAAHLAGDFVLPRDPGQKLAFVAGGIGVTPFVSMVRDLLMREERRDLVLLISNKYETGVNLRRSVRTGTEGSRYPHGLHAHRRRRDGADGVAGEDRPDRRSAHSGGDPRPRGADILSVRIAAAGPGITGLLGHLGITGTRIRTDYFPDCRRAVCCRVKAGPARAGAWGPPAENPAPIAHGHLDNCLSTDSGRFRLALGTSVIASPPSEPKRRRISPPISPKWQCACSGPETVPGSATWTWPCRCPDRNRIAGLSAAGSSRPSQFTSSVTRHSFGRWKRQSAFRLAIVGA